MGFKCEEVSKYTNSAEILSGRVKHYIQRYMQEYYLKDIQNHTKKDFKKFNFKEIDLVIANFYLLKNFKTSKNHEKILENIDIGGPTLVRAAAKNYEFYVMIMVTSISRGINKKFK